MLYVRHSFFVAPMKWKTFVYSNFYNLCLIGITNEKYRNNMPYQERSSLSQLMKESLNADKWILCTVYDSDFWL